MSASYQHRKCCQDSKGDSGIARLTQDTGADGREFIEFRGSFCIDHVPDHVPGIQKDPLPYARYGHGRQIRPTTINLPGIPAEEMLRKSKTGTLRMSSGLIRCADVDDLDFLDQLPGLPIF
jgi:hypothetical protein